MLDLLQGTELFAGLSRPHLERLAAAATLRKVAANEVLFRLGEEADCLFVVSRGGVDLTFPLQVLGEQKDVRFQSLGVGQTLAWSALVPPHRLTMGARATVDSELLSFTRAGLERLFEEEPRLGHLTFASLVKVVGTRLNAAQALWVREMQREVARAYR